MDKPQPAVDFLRSRGGGVMDLIAHFWERLAQTPPFQRADLHLVTATSLKSSNASIKKNKSIDVSYELAGAMLYVPKAHRADVLALSPAAAEAFVQYIAQTGQISASEAGGPPPETATLPFPAEPPKIAIDYLTGGADGIEIMLPQLLALVHRKAPARRLVNIVMQLPESAPAGLDKDVRLAKDSDIPILNRWRKLYKDERGIPFDADIDAAVQSQKVFVCHEGEQVVAVAKLDLELNNLVEIGGVYTFPEFRQRGFGTRIVCDLATRIRQLNKIPTLQVDRENTAALHLYHQQGWTNIGSLARVWLTG